MPARSRRGLSLLELVIVLFIVVVLLSVILPAINAGRGPRRNECLNNMRNVGLAVQNFASQNGGRLPPLDDGKHSWPTLLLRVLDQPALDRKIAAGEPLTPDDLKVRVFTCYQDEDSHQQPGGLSYVVNGGYGFFPVDRKSGAVAETGRHSLDQNWDGDGEIGDEDRLITQATGVFWRRHDAVEPLTLDDIGTGDGTGNTLLLTENLHAGPWTSRDARALAFVIGRDRLSFDPAAGPLAVTRADLGPFGVNGATESADAVPAPSSSHKGSINVIWADGRGGSMNENIDPLVYARILTLRGSLYGQQPVDESQL